MTPARPARAKAAAEAEKQAEAAKPAEERVEDYLAVDPMEVEIGVGLIRLADPRRGGDLLERIQRVRQNVAADIGIILPKVRIRDNMRLDQNQYRIKIADMPVAEGTVYPGKFLAIDSGRTTGKVPGMATRDPAFGTPALWIEPAVRDQAEMFGYTVVEPGSVIATHLTETRPPPRRRNPHPRRHQAPDRRAEADLAGRGRRIDPRRDEAGRGAADPADAACAKACPIRQLSAILETLGDYAPRTKDPILLTEYVRHRLARTICTRYRNAGGPPVRGHARSGPGGPRSAPASTTTSTGCSSACRRRPSRRPAGRSPRRSRS